MRFKNLDGRLLLQKELLAGAEQAGQVQHFRAEIELGDLVIGADKQGDANVDAVRAGVAIITRGANTGPHRGRRRVVPARAFLLSHPDLFAVDQRYLAHDMVLPTCKIKGKLQSMIYASLT